MKKNRSDEIYTQIKQRGMPAIDEFIVNRKSEELFLDFKRSADNGVNNRLHDDDRKSLAKAISGFGNSEGGVIVWGIDCSKDVNGADVAKNKFPLKDVDAFVFWIEGSVSGCTIPPHSKIENIMHPINLLLIINIICELDIILCQYRMLCYRECLVEGHRHGFF